MSNTRPPPATIGQPKEPVGKGTEWAVLIVGVLGLVFAGVMLVGSASGDGLACGSVMSPSNPESQVTIGVAERALDEIHIKDSCNKARSSRRTYALMSGIAGAAVFLVGVAMLNSTRDGPRGVRRCI